MPTRILLRLLVGVGVAVLSASCAAGDDPTARPSTSATVVELETEESSAPTATPSPMGSDGGAPSSDDGIATPSEDVTASPTEVDRAAALDALEEARLRWADDEGALYVWSYREEGEGLVDDFCVEGIVGGDASDAAACPFEGTPGGRSVESWFETIAVVLEDAAGTGRTADVTYDEVIGHPLSIAISGGEIDSLLVTSLRMELVADDTADGGLDELAVACADGDPDSCYDLGAAGGPLPASLVTGNELTQAPDVDVLDRCGAGEPAACHEAGFRGLTGD